MRDVPRVLAIVLGLVGLMFLPALIELAGLKSVTTGVATAVVIPVVLLLAGYWLPVLFRGIKTAAIAAAKWSVLGMGSGIDFVWHWLYPKQQEVAMPWSIKKRGSKFAVVNDETGKTKATFDSKEKARAYQKALYANVPEARSKAARGKRQSLRQRKMKRGK